MRAKATTQTKDSPKQTWEECLWTNTHYCTAVTPACLHSQGVVKFYGHISNLCVSNATNAKPAVLLQSNSCVGKADKV